MTSEGPQDITGLLVAWSDGNEETLSHVIQMVYPELRRIARRHLTRRGHTLESAALVNEVYLKLIRAQGIQCENRLHFFAMRTDDPAYCCGPCAQPRLCETRGRRGPGSAGRGVAGDSGEGSGSVSPK
jgi:hypothetical protein